MATQVWSRRVTLAPGHRFSISFQPAAAQVVIRAGSQTIDKHPGEPLVAFTVSLTPYGGRTAVATASYNRTSDGAVLTWPKVARPPSPVPLHGWTCELLNDGGVQVTVVLSIDSIVTQTVSFDVPLLNLLLAEALSVANFKVHVHTNDGEGTDDSYVTWSDAVTNFLKGKPGFDFPFRTIEKDGYQITVDADGAPTALELVDDGAGPGLRLTAQLAGNAQGTIGTAIIEWCTLTATIALASAQPTVTCQMRALANLGSASYDISSDLSSYIESQAVSVAQPYVATIKTFIDRFFVSLVRLENVQLVLGYSTAGTALTVLSTAPPMLPAVSEAALVQS